MYMACWKVLDKSDLVRKAKEKRQLPRLSRRWLVALHSELKKWD